MVRVSYDQKPYRRIMMETWGGKCVPSPSPDTNAGRKFLAENPKHSGSLGIAISEAIEDCGHLQGYQVLPGERAQPCAHAPDDHRPRGGEAACHGGGVPGRGDRVRRRREQLRRSFIPLRAGQDPRKRDKDCRGGADFVSDLDQGALYVRLRRYGGDHARFCPCTP